MFTKTLDYAYNLFNDNLTEELITNSLLFSLLPLLEVWAVMLDS